MCSGGQSLPTTPTSCTSVKKLAAYEKWVAEPAQQVVAAGLRRFDVINGDRTDNEQGHSLQLNGGRKNGKKEGAIIDRAESVRK